MPPGIRAAELRESQAARSAGGACRFAGLTILLAAVLGGCASPGEPYERKPPVPAPITNLAGQQRGDSVILTFAQPKQTVEGRPLKEPPEIEIYRVFLPPGATNATAAKRPASLPEPVLRATIPSSQLEQYGERGFIRYSDPLSAEDFARHSGWTAEYTVRTRVSSSRASANSNFVDVPIYPAPEPIEDLKAEFTRTEVQLSWTPPQKTPAGSAPPISSYEIFRRELGPPQQGAAAHAGGSMKTAASEETPFVKIGTGEGPAFRDPRVELGKTYEYAVRSVVEYSGEMLESADSNAAIITPKDVFPPAAPQGLVVVLVPREGEAPATLDLSWAISPETDIAGYNVYRNEQAGVPGTRMNHELLLTPAFRDMNALPGHRYFYTVTAVDRAGNESLPSAEVSGGVPAEK